MARVIDYAWARPTMNHLRSLGVDGDPVVGVVRYLSLEPSKNLSLSEYAQLKAAGFAVSLVWETNADIALGGYQQGVRDAQRANVEADALKYPREAAIYYAVDFEAIGAQMDVILSYFRGVDAGGSRKSGVYGSYYVVEAVAKAQVADYFWQTTAWSHGNLSPHRDLYQHIYFPDVDINAVASSDWGQDSYKAIPPMVAPPFPLSAGNAFGTPSFLSGHGFDQWQRQMRSRGWHITPDGMYGPQTKAIVLAFQKEKGLHVDGLVGPDTWKAAWEAPVT